MQITDRKIKKQNSKLFSIKSVIFHVFPTIFKFSINNVINKALLLNYPEYRPSNLIQEFRKLSNLELYARSQYLKVS